MGWLRSLLSSLAACTATHVGALSAAEIEVVSGMEPSQGIILIRGPIEVGDDARFFDIAESLPRAIVYLESPGGSVTTGISIAAEIALRNYSTMVLGGSGCHSICAVMWIAGKRRYMSPDADISVHAAYTISNDASGGVEATESGTANAEIGAFLNEIGLSREVVRYFTFAGPNEDLLKITPEIAQTLSIDVHLQTPDGTITPAERPTPRRIASQVANYAGLATHCTMLLQVDGAFWKEQSRSVLRRGHEIFGREMFAPLLAEYVDATKAEIRDLGFVRWCLLAEQRLRTEGLQTGIAGPSYDCSRSSTSTEAAICAHPDLWAADRAMASMYLHHLQNARGDRSREFLSSQRAWLVRRDQCADDVGCLYERYASRLFDLGG
ncbi:MAG: ATP-dependent Clp protease proteolytic subunit [Rhodobacteraceae bacterium]|nr:ATP-dependent Clp protease proteolytic subunit [Paracoccaceae bacterium]